MQVCHPLFSDKRVQTVMEGKYPSARLKQADSHKRFYRLFTIEKSPVVAALRTDPMYSSTWSSDIGAGMF